jgi:hypothetical protein
VSAVQPTPEEESDSPRIISPFAQTTSTVRKSSGSGAGSIALWIVSTVLVLVILGIVGYFTYKYVSDPYRTLQPFVMDKYLEDYRSMTGNNKYKAELSVAAKLDWNPNTGTLMLFTLAGDTHQLAVLVPPKVSEGLYFTKGQIYRASLEVQQDGTVYADSCEKE